MTETTEPTPLTQREMAQFVTLATMPTLERALERLRWLEAQNAALKPQSNADEFASIPLRGWVVEVFQHLCHSPHTPDEWKRDLDKKTIALLNAIEQGKEPKR